MTYVRIPVFITPQQRDRIDDLVGQVNNLLHKRNALSVSDVARLAFARLLASVGQDVAGLADALVDQAYTEAEVFPGRAKRGLPPRRRTA